MFRNCKTDLTFDLRLLIKSINNNEHDAKHGVRSGPKASRNKLASGGGPDPSRHPDRIIARIIRITSRSTGPIFLVGSHHSGIQCSYSVPSRLQKEPLLRQTVSRRSHIGRPSPQQPGGQDQNVR